MLQGPLPSAQSWKNLAMFELRCSPLVTSNSGCVISRGLTSLHLCMEKAMAPHSFTLAWKIPWMEEPDGLQSMGSLRVGHNWATSLSLIGEGNGNPLQCSCLENPRDGGAWWAAIYGVTQSWTRLKRLSSNMVYKELWCLQSVRQEHLQGLFCRETKHLDLKYPEGRHVTFKSSIF